MPNLQCHYTYIYLLSYIYIHIIYIYIYIHVYQIHKFANAKCDCCLHVLRKLFLYFLKWNPAFFSLSSRNTKNPPTENPLYLRKWKPRKNFLFFSKKAVLIFWGAIFGSRRLKKLFNPNLKKLLCF